METAAVFEMDALRRRQANIIALWRIRYREIPAHPSLMYEYLCLYSLVLTRGELAEEWQNFYNAAFRRGWTNVVAASLKRSGDIGESERAVLEARIAWHRNEQENAISKIRPMIGERKDLNLLLGGWLFEQGKLAEARECLSVIREVPADADAWGQWADVNIRLFRNDQNESLLIDALDAAVNGLLLTVDNFMPFVLRILFVVFRIGNPKLILKRLPEIPVAVWIEVLPQLTAKLNADESLRSVLQTVLLSVADRHPHDVLYAILVPMRSPIPEYSATATAIHGRLMQTFASLVPAFDSFINGLLKLGSSPWESWLDAIREAVRAFSLRGRKVADLLAPLIPLRFQLQLAAETGAEKSFQADFARILETIISALAPVKSSDDERVAAALRSLAQVERSVRRILANLSEIPVAFSAPQFAAITNSDVAIPGRYAPLVTIGQIGPNIQIRKHRRQLSMIGSDGVKSSFDILSQADVRIEERFVQLFKFVNTILKESGIPLKSNLAVTLLRVVPVSPRFGLVGSVDSSQSLREIALSGTGGTQIANTILRSAADSANWIDLRTNYAASLAGASVLGYVIGLGDRHPDNIRLQLATGRLVHINFRSAFELATMRNVYPDKVPFRLTTMVINGLEVSKIEGTFRACCENVFGLLRSAAPEIVELLTVFKYGSADLNRGQDSEVYGRGLDAISDKLGGKDGTKVLTVVDQVEKIIWEATNKDNLAGMWAGWCPEW
jgi:FKBP12-rapamycin complex-associated protein